MVEALEQIHRMMPSSMIRVKHVVPGHEDLDFVYPNCTEYNWW